MEADKIVVDRLKELIQQHEVIALENTEIATNYKKALSQLLGNTFVSMPIETIKTVTKPKASPKKKIKVKSKTRVSGNNTLKDIATNYIDEMDCPLSANSLREKYNAINGKEISIPNFSPRIAELTSKGFLTKCVIEGNPIKSKFMYAIPRMIENGVLKPEYLEKAKARGELQLF